MKTNPYLFVLLCLTVAYGCKAPTHEAAINNADTIAVQVMSLNKENSNAPVTVSGQFTTDDEVMLSFKTAGIISSLHVKEGDAVVKGQLLATLNPTEVNAQMEQAQLANEKARRDYQRIQNLYKDSVATLEQLQNSKTAMQQAEQQLRLSTFNRDYSEIHAPKNGFVLKKLANVGQQVTSGMAVLETNGATAGNWLLRVGISDSEWALLQKNDVAEIQTTALPGQVIEGVIVRKSEGVDNSTGTFTADIALAGKKPAVVAAGMFGKAVLKPAKHTASGGTWQVPYQALLDGDGSSGYVFVTNDDKTAHKVKVTVASIDKNTVTISDGLQDSKKVIVSGSAYLTDNSAIIIQPTSKIAK